MAIQQLLFGKKHPVLDWQKIKSKQSALPDFYRCAIPGGWLLRSNDDPQTIFICDAEHKWDGDSYQIEEN